MKRLHFSGVLAAATLAASCAHAQGDLIVRSGGSLIVRSNVLVNNGSFIVESGGNTTVDLRASITATNVVYGGTLILSANDLTLAPGQDFQLFKATSYSGAFLGVNFPALSSPLAWSNALPTNGSVSVRNLGEFTMQFSSMNYANSNLTFTGSGGAANGIYLVLTSTNVDSPKAIWTVIGTNTCDANGNFAFTTTSSGALPQEFFLLQLQ